MFDAADVRIHYVTAGTPPSNGRDDRTIVLLHGWPQTWWEFRYIIEPLHSDGWFVVAPDYRGAGGSSKPESGYDKQTMAGDIKALLDHLGVMNPITLVGHDLGMLVGYAYATPLSESRQASRAHGGSDTRNRSLREQPGDHQVQPEQAVALPLPRRRRKRS
ncbi:alpha/beta fold hydrolase [Streptomyces sp. NPDC001156]